MKSKLILIFLSILSFEIYGQNLMPELLSSSGSIQSVANTNYSWTLGEISVNTITSNDAILTQGFQQPRLHTTSVLDPDYLISAFIYPNPAENFINIDMKYPKSNSYALAIIDVNGNINKHILFSRNKRIDISNLKPGLYFIALNSHKGIELTGIKFLKLK